MSAPSGIKVPAEIPNAFSSATSQRDSVRALVFIIEGESFKLQETIPTNSTYIDDIALLPKALPSPKTPASFAFRLDSKDGGRYEWMMITYVPDDAGVRAKMLQASSRAGLMKSLGAGNFKHDWFATNVNDLSPSALTSHLNHLSSPAPLSANEKALAEVREAEAIEAKRQALDPEVEARRRKAVSGLAGKVQLQEGVEAALEKVAQRSDEGWVVVLEIPPNNAAGLSLVTSEACTPSQLSGKLPAKSPSFTLYSFPTPAPPPSAAPAPASPGKTWKSEATAGSTFQSSEGGRRVVQSSWKKTGDGEPEGDEAKDGEELDVKQLSIDGDGDGDGGEKADEAESEVKTDEEKVTGPIPVAESPVEEKTSPVAPPSPAPVKDIKGRVIFIYSCPSGSPVKYRMVYSTSVRGVQQEATNVGVEIVGKLETSDLADLTESHLRSALPVNKPTHASSLPTPSSANISSAPSFGSGAPKPAFGAPAPSFGGAFGRPRPVVKKDTSLSVNSGSSNPTQIPLPASAGPSTPISPSNGAGAGAGAGEDDGDSKERIKSAFDAFGPRVGGGGAGGGFARPKPAGRR